MERFTMSLREYLKMRGKLDLLNELLRLRERYPHPPEVPRTAGV